MSRLVKLVLPVMAMSIAIYSQGVTALDDFYYSGYLRSGIGSNSEGGDQVCFQAPGARSKYRLGNECENYAEVAIGGNLYKEGDTTFRIHSLFAYKVEAEDDGEKFEPEFRENYIEASNVAGGVFEGASFWAGKRFYRRNDVHLTDFYYWRGGGVPGAGIQDIDVGFGKFHAAWIRNVSDDFDANGDRIQVDDQALNRFDLELSNIQINPNGNLQLAADIRVFDESAEGFNLEDGFMLVAQHTQDDLWGGFNRIALQYGEGAAADLQNGVTRTDKSDTEAFRLVEQIVIDPNPSWSMEATFVYEDRQDFRQNCDRLGTTCSDAPDQTWYSIGARPVYHFNELWDLAVELGHDVVDVDGESDDRELTKLTLAGMLSAGPGNFARPVLRLFVTFAEWNAAARDNGLAGGADGVFEKDTDGITYGAQAEAWF